jgi:hypothetical protein
MHMWNALLRTASGSGVEARGGLDTGSGGGVHGRREGRRDLASSISLDLEEIFDQVILSRIVDRSLQWLEI